jgi:fibro-slime domain-containing protein
MSFQPHSKMLVGLFLLVTAGQPGCSDGSSSSAGPSGVGGAGGGNAGGSGSGGSTGDGVFTTGPGGTTGGGSGSQNCEPNLTGVLRDFRAYNGGAGHPDFEVFNGTGLKGLVKTELGTDHKPVYAPAGATAHTTGPEAFAQWYNDVPGVNVNLPLSIALTVDQNGLATYLNNDFLPIDGQGFGNEGFDHNYGFTFELHMTFRYKGGEIFSFTGDDDLWVFFNNRLGIDLGGLHDAQSETIELDAHAAELGLVVGQEYPLDFFQAERHSTGSNFGVQSTLDFTNCEPLIY